jgi:hypothetical protein
LEKIFILANVKRILNLDLMAHSSLKSLKVQNIGNYLETTEIRNVNDSQCK